VSGNRRKFRWYYVALPLLAAAFPFYLYVMAEPAKAVHRQGDQWLPDPGEYAGSASCRECHREITEHQLASSHARTIRDLSKTAPLAPFDTGEVVTDPLTGARYEMIRVKGRPSLRVTVAGQQVTEPLDFEFGSGFHAMGYLIRMGELEWVDARLNWYRRPDAWGFTSTQEKPNAYLQQQPLGRPNDATRAAQCFQCHSTVIRALGVGEPPMDGSRLRLRPEKSDLNITCEACHGPQGRHVAERRERLPVPPRSHWSADEMNQVCGRCHGLGGISESHPVVSRFQPYGLSRSACFLGSGGRLNCVSCHDPHADAVRDPAFYDARCIGCHVPPQRAEQARYADLRAKLCPVNREKGCTGCHMAVDEKSMPHIRFTDHQIRVLRK